jgi:succinate dehydrogenase / fumarate reductase flavoprotein subunit
MGGIPTNVEGEVLSDNTTVVPGLYAAGEVACVSVHGANRLGTNSLLDINVFGRRAGIAAAEYSEKADYVELPEDPASLVVEQVERLRNSTGTERVAVIRNELQECMDANVMVFRTEQTIKTAVEKIAELRARYKNVSIQDKGKRFNTDLLEAVELGNLLDLAEVMATSALARKESRGGHYREDFPNRDDVNFMRHTMAYREVGDDGSESIRLDYKPVVQTRYQPMERKY